MKAHTRLLLLLLLTTAIGVAGCVHQTRFHAPMQPDGWSAQPLSIACRFAPDADLDLATGTPVGDEGYYLYILTDITGNWDYSSTLSFVFSFEKNPGGHSWIILESPQNRTEYGHNGNFGLEKLRYQEGVHQRFRDNHPNPLGYLWEVMDDGRLEIGRPDRTPTFVWRMPITKPRYQSIHDYLMQRQYDRFGVRTNNCVDMVTDAAALAGINLITAFASPSRRKRRYWVGSCVVGLTQNTAFWSSVRLTCCRWTCASSPSSESEVMLQNGTWI